MFFIRSSLILIACLMGSLGLGSVPAFSAFTIEGGDSADQTSSIQVVAPEMTVSLPSINTNPGLAIASIIEYFILLASVLAVMFITWGGIQYILAAGEDEKLKKAKKIIIYAFVGLVLAGLAYTIVTTIAGSTINVPNGSTTSNSTTP